MKKFKDFVKRISLITLVILCFITAVISLVAGNVKSDLLNFKLPDEYNASDSIIIHFIHGSIPYRNCSYTKKRLGGYLGGHIEIEVNNKVYGFLYNSIPISYVPNTTFNSKFESRSKDKWKIITKDDKVTSVFIPVTKFKKNKLEDLLHTYLTSEPYDYAFFGQRCASSTAEILSDCGIINKFSNIESIIAFFYPRDLRFTMLQFANKNELRVTYKKGIICHKWE